VSVINPHTGEATMRRIKAMARMHGAAMLFAVAALAGGGGRAEASFHTFVIDELYSSPDGMVQFVELHEAFGFPGQNFLLGHALTSTQGATTRTYPFPANLPNSATGGKRVLIATPAFASLNIVTPDYIVPAPFLFPNGGRLDYAGVDVFAYPPLPSDGVSSLVRSGAVGANSPTNYAGQTGSIPPPAAPTVVTGIPALDRGALATLAALLVVCTLLIRRFR
jgi:hypothetical protein